VGGAEDHSHDRVGQEEVHGVRVRVQFTNA